MRGHIRQKSKGSWQITIDTGTGPDGRRGCKKVLVLRRAA